MAVRTELSLDIVGAKIPTERCAALDSFFVRELDGKKVSSPERQKAIDCRPPRVLAALAP